MTKYFILLAATAFAAPLINNQPRLQDSDVYDASFEQELALETVNIGKAKSDSIQSPELDFAVLSADDYSDVALQDSSKAKTVPLARQAIKFPKLQRDILDYDNYVEKLTSS